MTVDEILIGHEYLDRRGRRWQKLIEPTGWVNMSEHRFLTRNQMRLLVERDQHRDVCPGLRDCFAHPVPHVVSYQRNAGVVQAYPADRDHDARRASVHTTFSRAMDAARALAVGE